MALLVVLLLALLPVFLLGQLLARALGQRRALGRRALGLHGRAQMARRQRGAIPADPGKEVSADSSHRYIEKRPADTADARLVPFYPEL